MYASGFEGNTKGRTVDRCKLLNVKLNHTWRKHLIPKKHICRIHVGMYSVS